MTDRTLGIVAKQAYTQACERELPYDHRWETAADAVRREVLLQAASVVERHIADGDPPEDVVKFLRGLADVSIVPLTPAEIAYGVAVADALRRPK